LGKNKRGTLLTNTRKNMMRRCFSTSASSSVPDASWHHPQKIMKGSMEVNEFVEIIVREILDSHKTLKCRDEEIVRDKTRKVACLAKILRETATTITHNDDRQQGSFISTFVSAHCSTALVCQRPNMIDIEAKLSWMCRFF